MSDHEGAPAFPAEEHDPHALEPHAPGGDGSDVDGGAVREFARPREEPPAPDTREEVLVARGLTRRFRMGSSVVEILRGADLTLRKGEVVAIMGRSGAGKSTLLHQLGLLDRPDGGQLFIRGTETTRLSRADRCKLRNHEIGFVFQVYHLLPELTALQNAVMPLMIDQGVLPWLARRGSFTRRAREMLTELGLRDRLTHKPSQLSGGERQRVALARALVGQPSLLLCDEPTGNLDETTSERIADQLFGLAEAHGHTLVMVTHDADLAARADRTLMLHDGVLTD